MFNTMTLTKIAGGLIGALLFFLLGNWAASGLFATGGGHGDEAHAPGFVIAVHEEEEAEGAAAEAGAQAGTENGTDAAATEAPAVEVAMVGDPKAGEKVYKKCRACHKLEAGVNATGPDLYAIVGRAVAAREDFGYSAPMLALGGVWDAALLDAFLTKPKDVVPGTKMSFSGLRKEADRLNLIAYLETIGG